MLGNKYNIGKTLSEETKRKIGLASKGNQYAKGKTHIVSAEHRANLSKAGMGHVVSEETRKKISEAFRLKREAKQKALENVL